MSINKVFGSSAKLLNSEALTCFPVFERSKLFSLSPSATIFFLIFTLSFKNEKLSCSTATLSLTPFRKSISSSVFFKFLKYLEGTESWAFIPSLAI